MTLTKAGEGGGSFLFVNKVSIMLEDAISEIVELFWKSKRAAETWLFRHHVSASRSWVQSQASSFRWRAIRWNHSWNLERPCIVVRRNILSIVTFIWGSHAREDRDRRTFEDVSEIYSTNIIHI